MRIPSLKSWLIFGAGFVSCLACIFALVFSFYFFWVKPMQEKTIKQIKFSAPEFFTPHPAGFDITAVGRGYKPFNFQDYRGRVVVLNVWATWCPPCMAELPSLGKLAAHYSADKDVAVVCLSQESAFTVFRSKAAQASQAPIYSLSGHHLPDVYQTDSIPATFVIDKKGMIVAKHIGGADWSDPSVIALIDSLRRRTNAALESATAAP